MAKILIAHHVNLEARNSDNFTPLHAAVRSNSIKVIELLLSAGADIEAKERNGGAAMHIAASVGDPLTFSLLMKQGGKLEATANNGWTPLHAAASLGCEKIIDILIAKKVNLNTCENSGMTALHLAIKGNYLAATKLLLLAKADSEIKNNQGYTALHLAALIGNAAAVQLLLEQGADVQAKDNQGNTSLQLAEMKNHTSVINLLKMPKEKIIELNQKDSGKIMALNQEDSNEEQQQANSTEDISELMRLQELGSNLRKLRKLKEAEKCFEQALQLKKKIDGDEAVGTGHLCVDLARVCYELGSFKKSVEYFKQALVIYEKAIERQDTHSAARLENIAAVLNELGAALDSLGDVKQAKVYAEKSLSVARKINGENDVTVVSAYSSLGRALRNLGDAKQAIECYEKALQICRNLKSTERSEEPFILNRMARALSDNNQPQHGLACLEQALPMLLKAYGEQNPCFVWYWITSCEVYLALLQMGKAVEVGDKALTLAEKVHGLEHPITLAALIRLSKAKFLNKQFQQAKLLAERAVQLGQKLYDEPHSEHARALFILGLIMQEEKENEAKKYFEQALAIFKARLPLDHFEIKALEQKLIEMKQKKQMDVTDKLIETRVQHGTESKPQIAEAVVAIPPEKALSTEQDKTQILEIKTVMQQSENQQILVQLAQPILNTKTESAITNASEPTFLQNQDIEPTFQEEIPEKKKNNPLRSALGWLKKGKGIFQKPEIDLPEDDALDDSGKPSGQFFYSSPTLNKGMED